MFDLIPLATNAGAWTLLEFVSFLVDHVYPSGVNKVNWEKPPHGPESSWSPATFQMSLTFLQHIYCRICPPDEVNKFQEGLGKELFFRLLEFYSLLNMMTMNRNPRHTSEVVSSFQVVLCFVVVPVSTLRYTTVPFSTFGLSVRLAGCSDSITFVARNTMNSSSTKMPPVFSCGDGRLV